MACALLAGLCVVVVLAMSGGTGRDLTSTTATEGLYSSDAPIIPLASDLQGAQVFLHISDTHVDPFFDPTQSLKKGVCHTCKMSSKVFGDETLCPDSMPDYNASDHRLLDAGFAFGRYGCNPPYRLWRSLHAHIKEAHGSPPVVIFTGDIAPHGFPDDSVKTTAATTIDDLCETKFLATQMMVRDLVREFPETKWAFSMGNNDHFPKNTYWQPYISRLGKMFKDEGFFTTEQYEQFEQYGSNFIDVDGIRFLSVDFTLFTAGGETTYISADDVAGYPPGEGLGQRFPVRARVIQWVQDALADADQNGMAVYIIGHQPLNTNGGKDEMATSGLHYGRLKDIINQYSHIIKVGLFGHRNVAGLTEVLSATFLPLFPAITAPGVSPRGMNQPSFHLLYTDPASHTVLDFEQWVFDLMQENAAAKEHKGDQEYLGQWKQHSRDMFSWRALSGENEFTMESLQRFMNKLPSNSHEFFALQEWKKAGYIGNTSPEQYKCNSEFDTSKHLMTCLFPNQDPKCWDRKWLSGPK